MDDREKIITALEKAKKQSEEYAQDRIIVPFKEADMIIALLKGQQEPPHVVTCEECTHWDKKSGLSARWCETWKTHTMRREWCSRGIRKDEVQR